MAIGPMKKRHTEKQIIGFLREADAWLPVVELRRGHAPPSQPLHARSPLQGATMRAPLL